MVEHSTADREVPGSNPGAPSNIFFLYIPFHTIVLLYVPDRVLLNLSAGHVCTSASKKTT